MPQYAALIYEQDDADWSVLQTPEKQATMAEYGAFGATAAAVLRGARRSTPRPPRRPCRCGAVRAARSSRRTGRSPRPKRSSPGSTLIEAADLDEAVGWAAQIPAAWTHKVEVRPVIDFGDNAG